MKSEPRLAIERPVGRAAPGGQYFRSKIDFIFGALLIVNSAFGLLIGVMFAKAGVMDANNGPIALMSFLVAGFVVWVLLRTGYRITKTELIAQCGPIRRRVPLAAIEQVAPSRRWNRGLALSTDLLNVQYSGSSAGVDVSPADREGFLSALCEAAPALRRVGERVVRT